MTASTRVPSLALLALRAEATHNAYREHIEVCERATGGHWCSECDDLDFAADSAAFAHFDARQSALLGPAAPRVAAVGR